MASVRKRGEVFELTVQRKGVLPKPRYFTFDNEAEALDYGKRLETLLDSGIVPPELIMESSKFMILSDVVREYLINRPVATGDQETLKALMGKIGETRLQSINYKWVENWISGLKRVTNLAPSTIRHNVGSLARCFDWAVSQGIAELLPNPIRMLPKGYSTYSPADRAFVSATDGMKVKFNTKRSRRLEPGEEDRIRSIMNKEIPEGRERAFPLEYQGAIECMFELALESAMRMREIYTIQLEVIDFDGRTIHLKKTKNGEVRQVPLSSTAVTSLKTYMQHVEVGTRGMGTFRFKNYCLFPWWDGVSWGDTDAEKAKLRSITNGLSQQYARIFDAARCSDFNFHDLRHEATSRFFEKTDLQAFEIMKITGHSSIEILERYGNLRASNLAPRLW